MLAILDWPYLTQGLRFALMSAKLMPPVGANLWPNEETFTIRDGAERSRVGRRMLVKSCYGGIWSVHQVVVIMARCEHEIRLRNGRRDLCRIVTRSRLR